MSVLDELQAVESRVARLARTLGDAPAAVAAAPPGGDAFAQALAAARAPFAANAPAGPAPAPPAPGELDGIVRREAARCGVDPALVRAVIANESGFNPGATSPCGAQGLMQLMPDTARGLGVSDAYDPAQNVAGGTRYLRGLLDRFGGDASLAVAAYNAGPGAVRQYGGVPPYAETQNYVRNVMESYQRYAATARAATPLQ